MAKAFLLIRVVANAPDIPAAILAAGPVNWVLCDIKGHTPPLGAYLMAATGAQLLALNNLPYCLGIVAVTENGGIRWGELEEDAAQEVIDRLNTWLTVNDFDVQVPDGWTYRRLVCELYQFFNDHFDMSTFDIMDVA